MKNEALRWDPILLDYRLVSIFKCIDSAKLLSCKAYPIFKNTLINTLDRTKLIALSPLTSYSLKLYNDSTSSK